MKMNLFLTSIIVVVFSFLATSTLAGQSTVRGVKRNSLASDPSTTIIRSEIENLTVHDKKRVLMDEIAGEKKAAKRGRVNANITAKKAAKRAVKKAAKRASRKAAKRASRKAARKAARKVAKKADRAPRKASRPDAKKEDTAAERTTTGPPE